MQTDRTPSAQPDPDSQLQSVAAAALGEREGAIVVVDAQTGRIRALVNPALAFQHATAPGSTIKPFTALTALRAGVIDEHSRTLCRERDKHADNVEVCSHPLELPPFNPAEAIAHSCNYYFAKLGERIDRNELGQTLADFGFGHVTEIDAASEAQGAIVRAKWQPDSAIGEGEFLQATPIQLLMAYTSLLNGGRLFKPFLGTQASPLQGNRATIRSHIPIDDAERSILLAGMRGAVKFGTAEKAGLSSLPIHVVGKTGTSTPLRGFRSQGWFVGVAFAPNRPPAPENAQLAVVVYLKRAHGSDAAEVAAPIFKAFAAAPAHDTAPKSASLPEQFIAVHQVTENVTRKLSLEDYIARVVSVEGSTEDKPEALKALAIAARTYALKNLGRHKAEGYDFCSTTHCQRFESREAPAAIAGAVQTTAGLILRDERRQIAESYFGASCGGMTANLQTLWGKNAPEYLSGVRDDYCQAGFHHQWTDTIAHERLVSALRSDPRTDVGETIRELSVVKRDQTGRAELISILGNKRRVINGWDFKLIVGRALGWNVLKSSRFAISRSGSEFVFRGSGFGHGLGLCQEGAHVMAQRGYEYRQILGKYFPGTSVDLRDAGTRRLGDGEMQQRNSHFRVRFAEKIETREAEKILGLLDAQRAVLARRLSSAGVQFDFPNVEIVFSKTTGDFVGRTGLPPWAAAATRGSRIELQPLQTLKQRGILETTLRHELVHVVIESLGGKQTPRWLAEGLALYFAGEGRLIERHGKGQTMSLEVLEQKLASAKDAADAQTAYAAAYHAVRELIRTKGEAQVWKIVAARSYSVLQT